MDDKPKIDLSAYGIKPPQEREQDLAKETELWEKVEAEPENADAHKEYVGHVLRSGLLKEGSRRYGPIIDDKENFSIETRRLARYYQKQIVNLMFMTPSVGVPSAKTSRPTAYLWMFVLFIASMAMVTGLLNTDLIWVTGLGVLIIVLFSVLQFQKRRQNKSRGTDPTDDIPTKYNL